MSVGVYPKEDSMGVIVEVISILVGLYLIVVLNRVLDAHKKRGK